MDKQASDDQKLNELDVISKLVWTQRLIQAERGPDPELYPDFEWDTLCRAIRDARLFVLEPGMLQSIYNAANELVVEQLGHGPDVELPTALPFETVFVTAGGCLTMVGVGPVGVEIAGFVLSLHGGMFRAWLVLRDCGDLTPKWLSLCTGGRWRGTNHVSSTVIPQLCDLVNHQPRLTPVLSFATRREWKRTAPAGTFPQPYYVIKLPPIVSEASKPSEATQEGRKHASPSYRFDSRSHQRLLVYRGPNPLQESDRIALQARRYEVFDRVVPEKWLEAMQRRGHEAPKPDEWIAVRYTQVRQSVKGAAHLPYLPSIHLIDSR